MSMDAHAVRPELGRSTQLSNSLPLRTLGKAHSANSHGCLQQPHPIRSLTADRLEFVSRNPKLDFGFLFAKVELFQFGSFVRLPRKVGAALADHLPAADNSQVLPTQASSGCPPPSQTPPAGSFGRERRAGEAPAEEHRPSAKSCAAGGDFSAEQQRPGRLGAKHPHRRQGPQRSRACGQHRQKHHPNQARLPLRWLWRIGAEGEAPCGAGWC